MPLEVGLAVPSWHTGSISTSKRVAITAEWTTFEIDFPAPAPYFPDVAGLKLAPHGIGEFWIDDVSLWQHAAAAPWSVGLELGRELPGALTPPGETLPFRLSALDDRRKHFRIDASFTMADGTRISVPSPRLEPEPAATASFGVAIPEGLAGAVILTLRVSDGDKTLSNQSFRLLVGPPAPEGPQP